MTKLVSDNKATLHKSMSVFFCKIKVKTSIRRRLTERLHGRQWYSRNNVFFQGKFMITSSCTLSSKIYTSVRGSASVVYCIERSIVKQFASRGLKTREKKRNIYMLPGKRVGSCRLAATIIDWSIHV